MSKEHKERIQQRINAFVAGNLADNAIALFKELGYESNKRITLDKSAFEGLFAERPASNKEKALFDDWLSASYLFQLTEEEITRQKSLFSVDKYNPNEYQSYSFIAIELKNEHYARGKPSQITREVNKLFPMPVLILFKHGSLLTLSVINRRLHKRDESKDVLEKVTLIKDIRISPAGGSVRRTEVAIPLKKGGKGVVTDGVATENEGAVTHRAHIEILFDLSFDELKSKHGFTNFVKLHNAWQKTLDTKELNKRFFQELANWYFWATQKVEFPDDAEKEKDVRNATSIIRLITRLMFVWFLKEKGLVPDELFDEKQLKKLLKYTDKKQSTYYKAILQNLFFATLNTEMGKRRFRTKNDSGRDGHYFIHNVFRYENEFVKPKETLEQYFAPIPFLNGGLFECLDKELDEKGKRRRIRIDSFSDREDNVLKVPDELFFNEKGVDVDLSEIYGSPKKNKEKVRGLIDILNSYKFTISENTPIEEEIALDPELLGKVFENLLANYNPETKTTARKQTGSFYTPREIVNYMVDESLAAYLKHSLSSLHSISSCHSERSEESRSEESNELNNKEMLHSIQHDKNEERLRDLLSYSENPNPFNAQETSVLVNAIDTCKILDPACGSGAFPMGILHKLVHILHKLDPNNAHWKHRQLEKVDKLIEEAEGISDTRVREKVIEDLHNTRRDIEEAFDNNELDYGRKLYLIENCIYGVDIQPIAVQIARLRFFISLIVDQKVNPRRENLGIRPLPNLETKYVAANTLIGLEKEQANLFTNPNIEKKKSELKKVRHDYFEARTPKRKENCRVKDKQLRDELAELLIQNHDFQPVTAKKIAAWDPYDQNTSAPFFDPEWMFGLKEGFNVVIGNPPYGVALSTGDIKRFRTEYTLKSSESAILFIEKGYNLATQYGIVTYIIPKSFMFASNYEAARNFTIEYLTYIVDCGKAFDNVLLEANVFQINKARSSKQYNSIQLNDRDFVILAAIDKRLVRKYGLLPNGVTNTEFLIANKLTSNSLYLNDISVNRRGTILLSLLPKGEHPVIGGKEIDRFCIRGIRGYVNNDLHGTASEINANSVLLQGIVAHIENPIDHIKITACVPDHRMYFIADNLNQITLNDNSIYTPYFIRAILNSTIVNWFVYYFIYGKGIRTLRIDNPVTKRIPLPHIHKASIGIIDLLSSYSIFSHRHKKLSTRDYFELLIDAIVYEIYLPEEVTAAGANVLCHLQNLPDIQPLIEKGETEKALQTIEKIYQELSKPNHPISVAIFKMDTIEEIRIIEGKQ